MRVLLNASTLAIGGALQLGTSLIREAIRDPQDIDWRFALSRGVYDQVQQFYPNRILRAQVFDESPAVSRQARRRLSALELADRPDCVFTPYGPAYVQFTARHLLGAANPWVAHADLNSYRIMRLPTEQLKTFLLAIYRGYWFRRSEMLVVETEYVRQGYARRIGMPLDRIAVVPNSCAQHYWDNQAEHPFPASGMRIRLLCFAAPHKHKRVDILPAVARELIARRPQLDFEFVTTVNEKDELFRAMTQKAKRLGVDGKINNIGPVSISAGPDLYRSCDVCFLPTVLECSSATFAEAMAMGVPIITSDLGFLRDVCHDAALYFTPDNAAAAAEQILKLLDDVALWQRLLGAGKRILSTLPTASQKYLAYVRLLKDLYREGRTGPAAPTNVPAPKKMALDTAVNSRADRV
jgi:glycosyltransferase involved in cell wall biosynthesis